MPSIPIPVGVQDALNIRPDAAPSPIPPAESGPETSSSLGVEAKYKPVPPIPRKGQPARTLHCQSAAFKGGHRSALTVAVVRYLTALNVTLDLLGQQSVTDKS
jgi:hypothetical protein